MNIWQSTHDLFRNKSVSEAVDQLEKYLAIHDAQKFSSLIGATFTNPPSAVVGELNRFIDSCEREFKVHAVYLEMNGFDINYDRWYFDLFAYSSYSSEFDDTEWLCDWQSKPWPEIELSGMDVGRQAFAWYHDQRIWKSQPDLKPVYEASMLLVMAKFCEFVGNVLQSEKLVKNVPVLATAHGFESVARYES